MICDESSIEDIQSRLNKTKTPKKRSKISTKRRQTLTSKRILKKK
jgi:hypothetical protein